MMVSAKFQTIFPMFFKNVDVDLVFCQRNIATGTAQIISPELRFTLPVSSVFNNIELPPLQNPAAYVYSFDIYEKGTNTVPYNSTGAPFIPAAFPFQQNLGRTGGTITFEAGGSVLLLIKDLRTFKTTAPRNSMLSV